MRSPIILVGLLMLQVTINDAYPSGNNLNRILYMELARDGTIVLSELRVEGAVPGIFFHR
jgi:hypothetical protein